MYQQKKRVHNGKQDLEVFKDFLWNNVHLEGKIDIKIGDQFLSHLPTRFSWILKGF